MKLDYLLDEYPGDEKWLEFVNYFVEEWESHPNKIALLSKVNDPDISAVISFIVGGDSINWLESEIPALGGRTPICVLTKFPNGNIIIRSLLMRMPI